MVIPKVPCFQAVNGGCRWKITNLSDSFVWFRDGHSTIMKRDQTEAILTLMQAIGFCIIEGE